MKSIFFKSALVMMFSMIGLGCNDCQIDCSLNGERIDEPDCGCRCNTGWCGELCEYAELNCVNGQFNCTTGECDCDPGYTGALCDELIPAGNDTFITFEVTHGQLGEISWGNFNILNSDNGTINNSLSGGIPPIIDAHTTSGLQTISITFLIGPIPVGTSIPVIDLNTADEGVLVAYHDYRFSENYEGTSAAGNFAFTSLTDSIKGTFEIMLLDNATHTDTVWLRSGALRLWEE